LVPSVGLVLGRPCGPDGAKWIILGVPLCPVGLQSLVKTGSIMMEPVCGPLWDRIGGAHVARMFFLGGGGSL